MKRQTIIESKTVNASLEMKAYGSSYAAYYPYSAKELFARALALFWSVFGPAARYSYSYSYRNP